MYYYLLNNNLPISSDEVQVGLEEISEYEYQYRAANLENSISGKIDKINMYRFIRSQACFPVINRGQLWYNNLTDEQKEELSKWYNEWLNVTTTLVMPETPDWLK